MEDKAQRILNIFETGVSETELTETLKTKINASTGGSLGSIKPTDAAPTPARNGNYTFSIGGNKPAWLTAEAGVTEVKAGDGVAVVYAAPSSYTYTHVNVSSEFVTMQKINKIRFGSVANIQITESDTTEVTLTIKNMITIYDGFGGVRYVDPCVVQISNDASLIISANSVVYEKVDFDIIGSGEKVFLIASNYGSAALIDKDVVILGTAKGKRWSSLHPSFSGLNSLFYNIRKPAGLSIGAKGDLSIKDNGNNFDIILSKDKTIFDGLGGHRKLKAATINITDNYIVCLSNDPVTYQDPNLNLKGSGENIYLLKQYFGNSGRDQIGFFPLCANIGGKYVANIPEFANWEAYDNGLKNNLSKVQFSPLSYIQILEDATTSIVSINILTQVLVYDGMGGLRKIDPCSVPIAPDHFGILSATTPAYTSIDFNIAGNNSDKLFIIDVPWNHVAIQDKNVVILGVSKNNRWSPLHPSFSALNSYYYNIRKPAGITIGTKGNLSLKEYGNNYDVILSADGIVFDGLGGYRTLKAATINIAEYYIICLSNSATTFEDPKLNIKGAGENIYLFKQFFNSSGFNQSGYFPLCTVAGGKYIANVPEFANLPLKSRFVDLELKGLLPKRSTFNSPIVSKIPSFVSNFRKRRKDITVVVVDGSISTDMGYASKRLDQSTRPPMCSENNLMAFIEEKLRFEGQEFKRYDSGVFTEVGAAVTQASDAAWGWQIAGNDTSNNGLTRILTGANPSVAYSFPSGKNRCDFIFRTDYLSSASLVVACTAGLVQVYDESDSTWKEANGFVFSAKETNTLISAVYMTATNLRKSVYQKRLKMRAVTNTANKTITITSQDGGRLCYWGITHSPKEYMFQFINNARGGHVINNLRNFEAWEVDYWSPDLFLFSLNTINEAASAVSPSRSPMAFTDAYINYITDIKNKSYIPDILTLTLFTAKAHGIYDVNDVLGSSNVAGWGNVTVQDYINTLQDALDLASVANISAFSEFISIAKKRSEYYSTKINDEMFTNGGVSGNSFVKDTVHLNDYGAMIAWRVFEPYFDF